MATYRTTLTTNSAPEGVFDYLARFSSAVEWDPGVVASRDLRPGPVGVGSAFDLTVRIAGRDAPFRYEVTEIDRPHRVCLRAETGSFVSTDTIEVDTQGDSTTVTYTAQLDTKGIARILSLFLPVAFKRIGDRAAEGLQREIDRIGHPAAPTDQVTSGSTAESTDVGSERVT